MSVIWELENKKEKFKYNTNLEAGLQEKAMK